MCVERAFGMLKGRWRILLKRMDVHLKSVPELVTVCLILHNMCIIFGDNFWKNEWMREVTDKVHKRNVNSQDSGYKQIREVGGGQPRIA